MGIRNIAWDRMPNLRKLRDKGAFTVARSTFPTSSGVNWSSALCGTTPDLHAAPTCYPGYRTSDQGNTRYEKVGFRVVSRIEP